MFALFVSPTGNGEMGRGGNALTGANGNKLVRAQVAVVRFGAMQRRGAGSSAQSN
jgi:hypothetical protein